MRERVHERNNNLTRESFEISKEMFEDYLKCWEPPTIDEDFILVKHGSAALCLI